MLLGIKPDSHFTFWLGTTLIIFEVISTGIWFLIRYVIPGSPVLFARKVILSLKLKGIESALDVGAGRGLYAIEVAKVLRAGKVIGIDVWEHGDIFRLIYHHKWAQLPGNTIKNACRNAEL